MDLTFAKTFTLRGTSQIQFRFESFNVFNWRQLNNPNTTVTAPKFGQITSVAIDENGADRAAVYVLIQEKDKTEDQETRRSGGYFFKEFS